MAGSKDRDREINQALDNWEGAVVSVENEDIRQKIAEIYKKATGKDIGFSVRRGVGSGYSGRTHVFLPRPYLPEVETPARIFYPTQFREQLRYWRLFYASDPVAGNVIDMWGSVVGGSDFDIVGEGIEGTVKRVYEDMIEETRIQGLFPYFVTEYLVCGEVIPHCFMDEKKGYWTYIAFQKPEDVVVVDVPFVDVEPYVALRVPPEVKQILSGSSVAFKKFRERLSPELLEMLYTAGEIPLDTELNVTFIARKLHPYQVRGTSIYSRLWTIVMYEDAIFNASIQTARRHAAPVKVVKMGNPATGWVPSKEHQERLAELLKQAEYDVNAWLIWNYAISFEAWGTTDRVMSISREWDLIERVKLVALGVSKAFLHGEVTYASAEKGLQVFLMRAHSLRTFFEYVWWYPKFFLPVAKVNGFVKRTEAELSHRVRVSRSESEKRYLVPKLVWKRSLDPQIRSDILGIARTLKDMGLPISAETIYSGLGLSYGDEKKRAEREAGEGKGVKSEIGVGALGLENPYLSGLGGEGEGKGEVSVKEKKERLGEKIWGETGEYKGWKKEDVEGLIELLQTGETDDEFWKRLVEGEEKGLEKESLKLEDRLLVVAKVVHGVTKKKGEFIFNCKKKIVKGKAQEVELDEISVDDYVMDEEGNIGKVVEVIERDKVKRKDLGWEVGDLSWENIVDFLVENGYRDEEIEALREILWHYGLVEEEVKEEGGVFSKGVSKESLESALKRFGLSDIRDDFSRRSVNYLVGWGNVLRKRG